MKTYIYILTDCNRSCLHVGYTDDLFQAVRFYQEKRTLFFDSGSIASRLIYFEEFSSEEQGMARFNQLSIYTRPQKERLIRSTNPNWVDLTSSLRLSYHPGAKLIPNVPNLTSFR